MAYTEIRLTGHTLSLTFFIYRSSIYTLIFSFILSVSLQNCAPMVLEVAR